MLKTHTRVLKALGAAVAVASFAACSAKDLEISNPNNATVEGAIGDPTSFQLLATGLLVDQRSLRAGMITWMGPVGRESYSFQPTEGRPATHPVIGIVVNGVQKLDPTGFAVAPWAGQYQTLRDVFN